MKGFLRRQGKTTNLDSLEKIVNLCNSKHLPKATAWCSWCSHRKMILLPPLSTAYTPVSGFPNITKVYSFYSFEPNRVCARLLPCACASCSVFKVPSMECCTKTAVAGQFGNPHIFYQLPEPKTNKPKSQPKTSKPKPKRKRRTVPMRARKRKKPAKLWTPPRASKRCTILISSVFFWLCNNFRYKS